MVIMKFNILVASLCWIISVFSYGITSTGDWLQLLAASSWMLSNISSILAILILTIMISRYWSNIDL